MANSGRRIVPVIGYVLLIFAVSSIPALHAPGPAFAFKDKVLHFIEYLILGILLFRGIGWEVSGFRPVTFLFLVAVGASVGALDEIYQSYIPGREMSIFDWCADSLGVCGGVGLYVFTPLGRRRSGRRGGGRAAPAERRNPS